MLNWGENFIHPEEVGVGLKVIFFIVVVWEALSDT